MSLQLLIVACFTLALVPNEAARILGVFPVPSISHQVAFRAVTQELARRGHELIIITPDPAFPKGKTPANLTEIDVHDVAYKMWRDDIQDIAIGEIHGILSEYTIMLKLMAKVLDVELKHEQVQKLLNDKSQKFDLILAEACVRSAVVFSHIYKAPVILISSFGPFVDNYNVMGAPTHPLLYANNMSRRFNNLTMWDKIVKLYFRYNIEVMLNKIYAYENNMLRSHFGPDLPPIEEIYNNVAMLFLNLHPIFEGNYPVPPSVVHIGGIHQVPEKELPKDLQNYLDSSKNGVIYVSFGTNVEPSTLPAEKLKVFVDVLSRIPYDVLIKWNKDVLPGIGSNIKLSKWLPQSDLLRHPKVKLFIMQGGLQSTDEAITAGVPLIGIPMWGDQWYNAERYERLKIGLNLDIKTLTEEIFENAINNVIGDESYRRNIQRLNTLMRDQPQPPLERAIWWTEHVLRHGSGSHLRGPAANMSWAEYLELELILVVALILLLASAVSILAFYYLYNNVLKQYLIPGKVKRS